MSEDGISFEYLPKHQRFNPLELAEPLPQLKEKRLDGHRIDGTAHYTCHSVTGTDPFPVLPAEILQNILHHLPIADVIRLRQSSRVYANMPLSQSFWRSRFLPGREFEATRGPAARCVPGG